MLSRALVAVLATFVLGGCNQTQAVQAIDQLKPCTGDDTPVDAYCGTLKVYENRATKQGRQIDLNIVVLPALSADAQPDPLFFLAGGPGQGAAKLAKVDARDLPPRPDRSRHRPRRSARHRQVESARTATTTTIR